VNPLNMKLNKLSGNLLPMTDDRSRFVIHAFMEAVRSIHEHNRITNDDRANMWLRPCV